MKNTKLILSLFFVAIMAVACNSQNKNKTITIGDVSFNMVYVEGGTFTMGCTDVQDGDCSDSEKPAHVVTLSSYCMGETEVTRALWYAVMDSSFSDTLDGNLPITNITRKECSEFLFKLNKLTGLYFDLPTEAQWEYAARGGNKSKGYMYSGGDCLEKVAWYNANSDGHIHSVKGKSPNELGIYDMSGNVYEYCLDLFGAYSTDSVTDPIGSSFGWGKIRRGGSWEDTANCCRTLFRNGPGKVENSGIGGFRIVLIADNSSNRKRKFERAVTAATSNGSNKFSIMNEVFMSLIYVEGGTFTMGNSDKITDDFSLIDMSAHEVTLSSYFISETEVTQNLWESVMGNNPSYVHGGLLPVENVCYADCMEFVERLSQQTGYHFALPTEAQWEYAARGGSKSQGFKYSGSNIIDSVAWYEDNCRRKANNVKQKNPNELGIYDMSGNVWEWCADWIGDYGTESLTNPSGPATGKNRVVRGGSWFNTKGKCTVFHRSKLEPTYRNPFVGFRVVMIP